MFGRRGQGDRERGRHALRRRPAPEPDDDSADVSSAPTFDAGPGQDLQPVPAPAGPPIPEPVTGVPGLVRVLAGHTAKVRGVAFSPDGRLLASCGLKVWLWDPATGELQPTFEHTQRYVTRVHGVTCSPDGRLLASGGDDETVRLWDLTRPACQSNYARPSGRPPAPS